jgi:hypothetical protein
MNVDIINHNRGDKNMTYGSKEATAVLKAMENYSIENSGEKMVFNGPSGKYKAITGRARVDGSITGVVHKFMEDGSMKLAGSFKILSDGYISRWTGFQKASQTRQYLLVSNLPQYHTVTL